MVVQTESWFLMKSHFNSQPTNGVIYNLTFVSRVFIHKNRQIKLPSTVSDLLVITLINKRQNKRTKGASSLILRPTPFKGIGSSRKQGHFRVPPIPVHPHMGFKIIGPLLFAICLQKSPLYIWVGHFCRSSVNTSHRIAY